MALEKGTSCAVQIIKRKNAFYVIVLECNDKHNPIGPFATLEEAKTEKAIWKERLGLG